MEIALHSVSYGGSWPGQAALPLSDFLSKAKELGYEAVEIVAKRPHLSPLDLDSDARKRVKDLLAERGLTLAAIAGYQDFSCGTEHPDMARRQKELVYLRETLRLAKDLGCGLVRTYAGFYYPEVPFSIQWKWCVDSLKEGTKMAEDLGITIGLQNHGEIAQCYKDVLDMVGEVGADNLKIVLDAPALENNNEDYEEAVEACGSLIVHSHTSDFSYPSPNRRRKIAVSLGDGVVNYQRFVASLKNVGYQGCLSYEMCSPLAGGGEIANLDAVAKKSLEYIKGLLETIGS